jgi:hypothetical protein
MATFNQQGQHVNNQFNAENIHIGNISNSGELVAQVQQLITHVDRAAADGSIPATRAASVKEELEAVKNEAGKPAAEKTTLVKHLTKAQEILKGITAAGGLVDGLKQLIKVIGNLFI